tara:strand:+ start:16 stop:891 length:876 start_codon:yes stop_codon:yes gene_type:complete
MTIINVLGSSSLIGKYFVDTNIDYELVCFSRKNKNHLFLDLQSEDTFLNFSCENSFIVSFAPIWLVKDLIIKLEEKNLKQLKTLRGAIIYSSTSAITKKYAANIFDKNLSRLLVSSEDQILSIFKKYSINCQIIRPTIVYGIYKDLDDRNFVKIINLFKKIPFCIIPSKTGDRQPIHFSQLSKLTYLLLKKLIKHNSKDKINQVLEVGGDEEISYAELLKRLSIVASDTQKKRFRVIPIPNKIFYMFLSPLLIIRPKIFESFYRMQSDLSGFPKYSDYIGKSIDKFPVENF